MKREPFAVLLSADERRAIERGCPAGVSLSSFIRDAMIEKTAWANQPPPKKAEPAR